MKPIYKATTKATAKGEDLIKPILKGENLIKPISNSAMRTPHNRHNKSKAQRKPEVGHEILAIFNLLTWRI